MTTSHYLLAQADIEINAGRARATIEVANTGDRAVQVGSHYHFFEVNNARRFERNAAYGMRLDIPSGTAIRFEPGDTRPVDLVAFGGDRRMFGGAGAVHGPLDRSGRT
jgi:urease subunit beta